MFVPALRAVVGVEVLVALDGETEWTAEIAQFVHAHESEFRRSHTGSQRPKAMSSSPSYSGPILGPRHAGPPKAGSKRLRPF
jgi:hypothetical protein